MKERKKVIHEYMTYNIRSISNICVHDKHDSHVELLSSVLKNLLAHVCVCVCITRTPRDTIPLLLSLKREYL